MVYPIYDMSYISYLSYILHISPIIYPICNGGQGSSLSHRLIFLYLFLGFSTHLHASPISVLLTSVVLFLCQGFCLFADCHAQIPLGNQRIQVVFLIVVFSVIMVIFKKKPPHIHTN